MKRVLVVLNFFAFRALASFPVTTQVLSPSFAQRLRAFLALTKPRVVSLIVFTAVIGMFLATPGMVPVGTLLAGVARRSFLSLTAIFVVAGFVLGEGGLERGARAVLITGGARLARLAKTTFEACDVELVIGDRQAIARRSGAEPSGLVAERVVEDARQRI